VRELGRDEEPVCIVDVGRQGDDGGELLEGGLAGDPAAGRPAGTD
jgi:hypothetical protein